MDFKGKVAIVTGGAGGIGKAITKALLNLGMKVCVCDLEHSIANLKKEMSGNSNVTFVSCDVSSAASFRAAFEKTKTCFGRIDIVINNAGTLNEQQWMKEIEVNFIGVIHGIQLAFEYMGKNNGGAGGLIINTGSEKSFDPFDLGPVYAGTKHAVAGLTKSYGQPYHFEKTGITVNAICPGATRTPLLEAFPDLVLDEKVARKELSNMKTVSPDEIAEGVVKLLQDGKNGALLLVDYQGVRYVQ